MTLAVFLLFATPWISPPPFAQATAPPSIQSTPESAPAPEKQDKTPSTVPANNPSEVKQQPAPTPPARKPATAKRPRRKKKSAAVNCDSATTSSSGTSNPNSSNGSSAGADPAKDNTAAASASKNCPPTKIIVRHGGTAEPSIQLAPSTDQAARQRDVVNQLLGATDANLKRIAGKDLNTNQQATLGQIRDFEHQSRAALADGDLERARTLAWKAELLSEDLVKPQK